MKIAIMGTGGVGGYFGGLLARAGNDVTFIARGAHLQAIRQNGLRVESMNDGDFRRPRRRRPGHLPGRLPGPGALHRQDVPQRRRHRRRQAPHGTRFGGPDPPERHRQRRPAWSTAFGRERVLIGSCYMEGRIREPGVVTQGGPGMASFGELEPGITERCREAAGRVSVKPTGGSSCRKTCPECSGRSSPTWPARLPWALPPGRYSARCAPSPETRASHPGRHRGNPGSGPCLGRAHHGRLPGMVHDLPGQLSGHRHVLPGQGLPGGASRGVGRPHRHRHRNGATTMAFPPP